MKNSSNSCSRTRESYYKTARATIGCAKFNAGEFVAISLYRFDENGLAWFSINKSERKSFEPIYYPAHHLSEFCL